MVGRRAVTVALILVASQCSWPSLAEVDSAEHQAFADSFTSVLYTKDNEISSALGVSMAMSLVYPGCTGDAVDEVRNALGYPSGPNDELVWDEASSRLMELYDGQCQDAVQEDGECSNEAPTLNIANVVLYDVEKLLDPQYESIIGSYAKQTDFESLESSAFVNDWVEQQTGGHIDKIVPEDEPLYPCQLLAVSSIFLRASWECPFPKDKTTFDSFYTDPSRQEASTAQFMHEVLDRVPYSHDALPGYQVVELQLARSEMSMIIVLPTDVGSQSVASSEVLSVLDTLRRTRLALSMPKFAIQATYDEDLKAALKQLGIVAPFDKDYALCGIFNEQHDCQELYIDKVLQSSCIDVNENGLEAAAATSVSVKYRSVPRPPVLVVIDHPFQFFIYDKRENLVMFEGRLGKPTVSNTEPDIELLDSSHSEEDFWAENFGVEPTDPPIRSKRKISEHSPKVRRPKTKKVCIDLGGGLGKHTFEVPYKRFRRIRGPRNAADALTTGACNPREVRRLRTRLKREKTFCFRLGRQRNGKDRNVEVVAPAAARRWLKRRGATDGECDDTDAVGDEILMKLIE